MDFIEEVKALNFPATSNGCKVKLFVESQDSEELTKQNKEPVTLEQIKKAKENSTLKAIHRALVNRGFKFSDNVLAKHLQENCSCVLRKDEK